MHTDPPKDDDLERMLQEVCRTLQENQRFLEALKQDRLADDELDADDAAAEEEFEEL